VVLARILIAQVLGTFKMKNLKYLKIIFVSFICLGNNIILPVNEIVLEIDGQTADINPPYGNQCYTNNDLTEKAHIKNHAKVFISYNSQDNTAIITCPTVQTFEDENLYDPHFHIAEGAPIISPHKLDMMNLKSRPVTSFKSSNYSQPIVTTKNQTGISTIITQ
jgi:hypothetical protein